MGFSSTREMSVKYLHEKFMCKKKKKKKKNGPRNAKGQQHSVYCATPRQLNYTHSPSQEYTLNDRLYLFPWDTLACILPLLGPRDLSMLALVSKGYNKLANEGFKAFCRRKGWSPSMAGVQESAKWSKIAEKCTRIQEYWEGMDYTMIRFPSPHCDHLHTCLVAAGKFLK